ncbi:MAG: DNA protecting protein DprA [Firmicutes bacterium ZCTH02-B6]|nr:MAG: DNA protecting protein DprA [Firmicutes bacterium ZCTH02-B6]
MDERLCLLALRLVPGIGPKRITALLDRYGSAQEAWRARGTWDEVPGIGTALAAAARRVDERLVETHWHRLAAMGARVVTSGDADYPPGLHQVPSPPPVLFVKGALPPAAQPSLAIVGTRRASPYGLRTARTLGRDLAAVGVAVISGLARGVDTAAHRGALDGQGTTVAVLGSGLDVVYPPENRDLMEEIAVNGALVTEYPLGTQPQPGHFPARNRIIVGLAQGVVLVEGSRRSGAMRTVAIATDCGREVMAVPGDADRWGSDGPNHLVREGAALVRHAVDVLDTMGWAAMFPAMEIAAGCDPEQVPGLQDVTARLLVALQASATLTIDELAAMVEAPVGTIVGALIGLELAGRVIRLPGGRFSLPR